MTPSRPSLRIGIVCFSTFGGSGVIAAEIGMALGLRGHRVFFLSDRAPARLDSTSANVSFHQVIPFDYPLMAHSSYALALTAKMIEVARAEKLDLFHLHYAVPHAASAFLANQVLGASAPKVVTTLHGTDVTLVGADVRFQPLTQFTVASSDAITVPSQWLADQAYGSLGLSRASAIEVIPNFVDTRRFCPPGPLASRGLGARARQPRVLTHVSNFRPLKRLDDVVKIFAAVRGEVAARLELVGEGPERPRIEALVRSLGLAEYVRFLSEKDDLVAALQRSDVFLLPSETESFGLAALEAMACGVPVVASDVGGVAEVVSDGDVGFLAPVGDVAAMAGHACRLLTDDDLHLRLSRAARQQAETHYQRAPAIDRYEAVYRRVLDIDKKA